jgi:hypothetical protein
MWEEAPDYPLVPCKGVVPCVSRTATAPDEASRGSRDDKSPGQWGCHLAFGLGALGGIRTPNLLIRSLGQAVPITTCPSRLSRYGGIRARCDLSRSGPVAVSGCCHPLAGWARPACGGEALSRLTRTHIRPDRGTRALSPRLSLNVRDRSRRVAYEPVTFAASLYAFVFTPMGGAARSACCASLVLGGGTAHDFR